MSKKLTILLTAGISIFAFVLLPNTFNRQHNADTSQSTDANSVSKDITILLTGDIMLGRSVMTTSLAKNDPKYPFEKVADTLKSADIVFGNLENPIIASCPESNSGFKFCADPKMIQGLTHAGVDIVNLANNHSRNYGEDGIVQTRSFLKDSAIDYVGDNNFVTRDINGIKFGFLGFDYVDNSVPKDSDYQLVKDSKRKVDVLLVMLHWGVEYTPEPTNAQKAIAKGLARSGASVVVGGHPHWVQSVEDTDGVPVFYSLGNFIFDQAWSEETKKGLAVRLTYNGDKLVRSEKLPIYMREFAQPEWVNSL